MAKSVYVIGSLRNKSIPIIGGHLRSIGFEAFTDWHAAGPEADDHLRDHYRERGFTYDEVLNSYAAKHIFEFDLFHLNRCDIGLLVMPAGKSGHLELGYMRGQGKDCFTLMDAEPERVDIMTQFSNGGVFMNLERLLQTFKERYK